MTIFRKPSLGLRAALLGAVLTIAAGVAAPASAQSSGCPSDFTYLTNQLQSQQFQGLLSTTVGQLIARAGNVDAAIATAQQELQGAQNMKAKLGSNPDPKQLQIVTDAILLATNEVSALQCVKSAQ